MAAEAQLGILLSLTDNATPQLKNLATTVEGLPQAEITGNVNLPNTTELSKPVVVPVNVQDNASTQLNAIGDSAKSTTTKVQDTSTATKGLSNTLVDNKMAIRELAMGTTMLGASFMAMGIALKGTNSALGQSIGQTVMMAGAIMTAIGSSVQFISAIAKTVDALKKLATMEAIVKAFQGPTGWAILGISAAVAVGTVAAINKAGADEKKAQINVHITNDPTKVSQMVRRDIILTQNRNNTSGIK